MDRTYRLLTRLMAVGLTMVLAAGLMPAASTRFTDMTGHG